MKQGKVWGTTELIDSNQAFEMHRIESGGGSCSVHMHKTKWNGFYVMCGVLTVRTWPAGLSGRYDEVELCAGEYTKVEPGIWHQFLVDPKYGMLEAMELYWSEFDPADIVRDPAHLGSE